MAEIIGEHMMPVFEWLHIFPKNTYCGSVGYWSHFEVWELSESELDKLIKTFDFDIGDEDWNNIASAIATVWLPSTFLSPWWTLGEIASADAQL